MHDWMQESSAGGYLLHLSKLLVIESPSHLGPNPVLHPWHIFEPFARRSHRHRASLRLKILQAISQMKKLSNEKNQNNISASHIFNVHCPSSISLQLSLSLSTCKSSHVWFFLQIFKLWQICAGCGTSIADPTTKASVFLQQLVLHNTTNDTSKGNTGTTLRSKNHWTLPILKKMKNIHLLNLKEGASKSSRASSVL